VNPKYYKQGGYLTGMDALLKLIFVSLLPWIELRGSIPLGISMGLDPLYVLAVCTLSDILLIPVLLLLLRFVVPLFLRIESINRLYQWNVVGTLNRYEKYRKWEQLGLALFVAIPLPFTGVYSGTFVSYLLNLNKKEAFVSIASGASMAGIIVTAVSVGILG
jgi:uncharacterized membrane protein